MSQEPYPNTGLLSMALVLILPYIKTYLLRYLVRTIFYENSAHIPVLHLEWSSACMRKSVIWIFANFISLNILSLKNNYVLFHILESATERMANLFANTHVVPVLLISKLHPKETCLMLGNLLNLFLLGTCKYCKFPTPQFKVVCIVHRVSMCW